MHSIISWYCRRKLKRRKMYGAYLDVAAYNSNSSWDVESEDFLHTETLSWLAPDGLPPEPFLGLSSTPRAHNSTTCSSCKYELMNSDVDDFILICEVSELEGPKPLVSIPHHSMNNCRIDANALSEKLMSIDYNHSNCAPFDNCQDTQVILSSVTEEFHAFSNYFNLYDISARGFVRPVCIAYITSNKRKLIDFVDSLRTQILNVSKCLKFGNRKVFLQDLHLYLRDLQTAKDNYVTKCRIMSKGTCAKEEENVIQNNSCTRESSVINQFAENIIEIQHILASKKPILEDANMARIFYRFECHVKSQFRNDLYIQIKHFVQMEPTRSSKLDSEECNAQCALLRSIFKLCSWGIVIGLTELISLQKFYKRDLPTVYVETEDLKLLDPSEGILKFGNHVLTNIKSSSNELMFEEMNENLADRLEKHVSQIQAIFSELEPNSFNCRSRSSSPEFESDDEFDDAHSCNSSCLNESLPTFGLTVGEITELRFDKITLETDEEEEENVTTFTGSGDSYCSVLESPPDERRIKSEIEVHIEDEMNPNSYLTSLAKHVEFLSPDKPGYGIAKVFARLHNFCDIFYSLLTGCQVIIAGNSDEEDLVRSVVQAFDILVPDKRMAPNAFPWCTNGIKSEDIDRYKLIGLCVPNTNVENFTFSDEIQSQVVISYVGKNIYVGPVYSGHIFESLHHIMRSDWDDSAFLCFLHSRLLTVISRLLLYRNFLTKETSRQTSSLTESKTEKPKHGSGIVSELNMHVDDVSILKYFHTIFKDVIQ